MSGWHAFAIVFAVGTVGVASVTQSGEHQEDEPEPQDSAPAEMPFVRVGALSSISRVQCRG